MKILIANLGSTSFKYRLFDMEQGRQLARGGVDRIGHGQGLSYVEIGTQRREQSAEVRDHAAAVEACLRQLTDPDDGCLESAEEVAAIGFKAVHGGRFSGVQRVDDDVLTAMEEVAEVAPAHNPPYLAAMRQLREKLPQIPLVAAFETGFHQTIPERLRLYAAPYEWATEHQVQRWGFHGASHRYIAQRTAQMSGRDDLRVISCHLGGSSSLSAIRGGASVGNSLGMSPQSGLPHNNRVGDIDPFAVRHVMRQTGRSIDDVLDELATNSGLLGISGLSGDVRDLESAAAEGNARAALAIEVFVSAIRHYLGAYLVELGGCDWIVFTGGIGENSVRVRTEVCAGLEAFGIRLADEANRSARGEACISPSESPVAVWVIPTNEEWIVAQQTHALLE